MVSIGQAISPAAQPTGATMNTTEQELQIKRVQVEEPSIVPAIVTCVTGIGGTLGAVLIAAGPWLALNWYW
jgi:hypothetical protein